MNGKRMTLILYTLTLLLLTGCMKEAPVRKMAHDGMTANAVVLEIGPGKNEITVKDADSDGIFGSGCTIDCTEASFVYCDYESGEVRSISLADLSRNDEVIIEISASEIQNAKNGRAETMWIQLNTQRLK